MTHTIPTYGIKVVTHKGSGTIRSKLKKRYAGSDRLSARETGMIDALEAFLLAMACEGIDISTPQVESALTTVLEGMSNDS